MRPPTHSEQREAVAKELEQDIGISAAVFTSGLGLVVAGLGGDWLSVALFIGSPLVGAWMTLRVRRVLADARGRY